MLKLQSRVILHFVVQITIETIRKGSIYSKRFIWFGDQFQTQFLAFTLAFTFPPVSRLSLFLSHPYSLIFSVALYLWTKISSGSSLSTIFCAQLFCGLVQVWTQLASVPLKEYQAGPCVFHHKLVVVCKESS